MHPIARRLLVAAVRKLLPDAVPDHPGSALALRSDAQLSPFDQSSSSPSAHPQILYAPPRAPLYPVAAPAPPPRRRRKMVIETVTYEEREW